jgi:hypothetical protein
VSSSELEVVTAGGTVIRRLARVEFFAQAVVSPNGKLIAWTAPDGLVVERIDGSARRLVDGTDPFVWSPNSKAILTTDPSGDLEVVSVATAAKRPIVTRSPGENITPLAWPRSQKIVFEDAGASSARVILADQSGSSERTISRTSIYDSGNVSATVSVSPNRNWINVITTFEATGDPTTSQFESVNVLTGKKSRARPFGNYLDTTVWSPDSSSVVAAQLFGPLKTFSPSGKLLATIRQSSLIPIAWTQSAMYLLPASQNRHKLLVIPAGHSTAEIAFTRPRQWTILSAQLF